MMLPEGSVIGTFAGGLSDVAPFLSPLVGALHVIGPQGEGFLLIEQGKILASYYRNNTTDLKGIAAHEYLSGETSLQFELRRYTLEEFSEARETCVNEGLLIAYDENGRMIRPPTGGEWDLDKVKGQPGVLAVAAFHEGFAVQSTGSADFDQVAAVAEDLLRSGKRIATDLKIDPLHQMILETPHGKFIIAPFGDLNICIFTEAEANLGLIRIAIQNIQSERE